MAKASAKLTKPFVVPGKYAKAVLTQKGTEKIVGQIVSKDGGRYPVDKQGRTYKTFLTLSGAKTWARRMVKGFDAMAEGRQRHIKGNPSQVATLVARGNKKVFVIATDSSESNEALLNRANAIRVIKRVNTNPAHHIAEYNGKVVVIDYVDDPKREFRVAAQRVRDNLIAGTKGYVITPKGERFEISRESKTAKRVNPTRNSVADEWDFEDLADEGAKMGSQVARALGQGARAHAKEPKRYNVTWYSPRLGKRTGFIRPIEADTQAAAKAQAKAMITNDPKASNFIAKEAKRNPTRTSTEVRSPTKTSTWAKTEGNITVTGGAGEGATTKVIVNRKPNPRSAQDRKTNGRSTTPPYRLDIDGQRLSWRGPANNKALAKYVFAFAKSLQPGGANEHLAGDMQPPSHARIIRQSTGEVVAEWRAGTFQVYNPATAREMSERFNGQASGRVTELKASNRAPRDLSRAGKLVFLKLVGAKAQLRIPGAVVCIDPKTEKLWIAGNRTPLLNKRANPGEALDFGEIDRICYETAKAHIGDGKTVEYVHTFGEDGGRKPRLQVDAEGMPVIVGGDYKIKAEGIVN